MERVIPRSDQSNSKAVLVPGRVEARRQRGLGTLGANSKQKARWQMAFLVKGQGRLGGERRPTGATLVTLATLHEVAIDVIVSL